ncbi:DUF6694 family lipoprotein [Aliarcobacter butzleri]|uniref:DUF6694 family lipoprotein n=1 Tax=Aliarcobacter butzleri TaxID=28197 RepID=UPI0012FB9062|nr:DUF6694 family lipoprotein [Aliarcobacter butzleri]
MVKGLVASIIIAFIFVGCGSPRIDASNDEKLKTSIEEVKKSLSDEKKQEFEDALKVVYFSKINFDLKSIMAFGSQETANNMINEAKALLNNKTADEVILEAKKIKDKIFEEEKQEALKVIKLLEDKKVLVQKSVEELKKIEIGELNFNREKQQYSSYLKPTITINLKNNTDKSISKVYAVGIIQTEGRSVPWIKEEFSYTIDGGIEPGETNKSVLAPNMFSSWGTANIGENATFNINILRIDGADGNPIATLENFSEQDSNKLEELKAKYLNK